MDFCTRINETRGEDDEVRLHREPLNGARRLGHALGAQHQMQPDDSATTSSRMTEVATCHNTGVVVSSGTPLGCPDTHDRFPPGPAPKWVTTGTDSGHPVGSQKPGKGQRVTSQAILPVPFCC